MVRYGKTVLRPVLISWMGFWVKTGPDGGVSGWPKMTMALLAAGLTWLAWTKAVQQKKKAKVIRAMLKTRRRSVSAGEVRRGC